MKIALIRAEIWFNENLGIFYTLGNPKKIGILYRYTQQLKQQLKELKS